MAWSDTATAGAELREKADERTKGVVEQIVRALGPVSAVDSTIGGMLDGSVTPDDVVAALTNLLTKEAERG